MLSAIPSIYPLEFYTPINSLSISDYLKLFLILYSVYEREGNLHDNFCDKVT